MIYLIYGPDRYRVRHTTDELISAFLKKHPQAARSEVNANDPEMLSGISSLIRAASLFDPARVVYFKNVSLAAKDIAEELKEAKIGKDELLFVVLEDMGVQNVEDKKIAPLFQIADVQSKFVGFLPRHQLFQWLKRESTARDIEITGEALEEIVGRVGGDSAAAMGELQKIQNYATAVSRPIQVTDIQVLVAPQPELNIFNLVDALATKNKARALELLFTHLSSDPDAYGLLHPVLYQFRNLLIVHDLMQRKMSPAGMAKFAGLAPFVVQKTIQQAKSFTAEELKRLYGTLLAMDIGMKKGSLNLEDELYRFILR